ncbi:alpha/beta hydrolase [Tenacibaculum sp. 1B UA]|uniref:RBBP9/YdeN family alpha/beta hydrolase n=1 Tax=Tenacibaculum sp. 1B UA TaxID=2922252 RepID=UPI002A246DF2|nr:alpha/beta hydrolase [Tenacibaculum sp. 1B UA]MDX8553164.1 alpha/beta hydrolase [Tenacibaculum sp. 1B UA]
MPNSKNPKLNEWVDFMESHVTEIDEKTIFVGHSLGCIAILNFLNKLNIPKIKGLFLISGFIESTPIPELIEFVKPQLNYSHLKEITSIRTAISAVDDDIIPFEYSKTMAEKLEAKFTLLKEGKHFIDRDGFTKLPFLIEEIKRHINLQS